MIQFRKLSQARSKMDKDTEQSWWSPLHDVTSDSALGLLHVRRSRHHPPNRENCQVRGNIKISTVDHRQHQHSYNSTDHVLSTVLPQGFVSMHFGPRKLLHFLLLRECVSRAKAPIPFCNVADREGLGLVTGVLAKVYPVHLRIGGYR